MRRIYKTLIISCAVFCAFVTFAGCQSNKNKEQQEAYRQYGITCMKKGDYEEALKAFQNALDQSIGGVGETEIDICLYKAKTQYLSGDLKSAEETYTALIDYKDYPQAYYQRGCFYFATGKNEKGMSDFEKAIEEDSKNYELYIGISETLKKYGYEKEPEEYLKKALEIKGSKGNDLMMKGRIYMLLEDYDKAISNLTEALEKDEKQANFYLAQVYAVKGDDKTSNQFFQEYTKSGVASADDLSSMAQTLMNSGDYETAKQYLEAAAEMPDATDLATIRKNTIICYENLGDFEKAKSLMEAYVADYPDDEEAKKDYTFLKTR